MHGTNGTGGRRRVRNAEGIGLPVDFGPLARWVGFNLRMAQESAFQAFSRGFGLAMPQPSEAGGR